FRYRCGVGLLLISYLIAVVGFPIPAAREGASFSCSQRPCGCLSAEECRHCCCAKETAGSSGDTPPCEASAEQTTSCHGCPSCGGHGEAESTCCGKPSATSVRWVTGVSALACKGLSLLWVSAGVSFPHGESPCGCSP